MADIRKCVEYGVTRDDDPWHASSGSDEELKAILLCLACPFKRECALDALQEGVPYGVLGGTTAEQRWAYWRANGGRPHGFDAWREQWVEAYEQRKRQEEEAAA